MDNHHHHHHIVLAARHDDVDDDIILICPIFLPQAGCDKKSIFIQSETGLNLEFSLFYTGCLRKTKEPSLLYYLPLAGW